MECETPLLTIVSVSARLVPHEVNRHYYPATHQIPRPIKKVLRRREEEIFERRARALASGLSDLSIFNLQIPHLLPRSRVCHRTS